MTPKHICDGIGENAGATGDEVALFAKEDWEGGYIGGGMGPACRGGGAIACIFSRVEPTGRRGAGCGFSLLRRECAAVTGNDQDGRRLPGGGNRICN